MSLFSVKRSSRRNIRKKVIELEEEEEGEGAGGEEKEGDSAPPTLERPSVVANKVNTDIEPHCVVQEIVRWRLKFFSGSFSRPSAHILSFSRFPTVY